MSDPTGGHPQAAEGQAPDPLLTERLLARGTRPLGLIDVRRAEGLYARIMDWLAMRTPLLEHLKARYGLTGGEGAAGLSLAFAEAARGEGELAHAGGVGINLSAGQDAFAPRAAEGLVTYVARVPDDSAEQVEAKRITRRGVPTFSRAGSETQHPDARRESNEAARQQQGGSAPTPAERAGSSLERAHPDPEHVGLNVEGPGAGQALPSVKEIPAAPAEAHDARVAGAPLTPTLLPATTAPPESTQSPVRRPSQPAEGRATAPATEPERALEPPARGRRSNLPSVKEIPAAGTPAGSEEQKPLTSAGVLMTSPGVLIPARPGASGVYGAPDNDTSASGTPAHADVPGNPAHIAEGRRETPAPGTPAEKPMPLARAREFPAEDSRRESPTLRAQSPLPLASNPAGAERGGGAGRQTDSAAAAAPVPPVVAETITPGGKGPGARAGGVNVERLTEQVSRHLARRLLVERERRGMSKG